MVAIEGAISVYGSTGSISNIPVANKAKEVLVSSLEALDLIVWA